MKYLLLTTLLIFTLSAEAKAMSPQDIGKHMAESTMCLLSGRINKPQSDIIKLKMAKKYNLGSRDQSFRNKMKSAERRAFKNFSNDDKEWTKDIACKALKDKWL